MIADLDHESSLDPAVAGSKGAQLAVARRNGLPVLAGFVVTAATSRAHMRLGAEALPHRGSGGARLVVSGEPIDSADTIVSAGRQLGSELVARSSTLLESSGAWAGAFTSYVDVAPEHLPKAVAGCWASAFSVEALERQEAAGVPPGSFDMAVVVQPALHPRWGGAAERRSDGTTIVHGIQGSPAPLLQGWVAGYSARSSARMSWEGDLVAQIGAGMLDRISECLERAGQVLGANRCEWAIEDGALWLLQLDTVVEQESEKAPIVSGSREDWLPIVRTLMSAPGTLGAELVLPWAIRGGVPQASARADVGPEHVRTARMLSRVLAGQVWGMPADEAIESHAACLRGLLQPDPEGSLERIRGLGDPDPELAHELMSLVHGVRQTLAGMGAVVGPDAAWHLTSEQVVAALGGEPDVAPGRVGAARWEPLIAAVVLTHGDRQRGAAASPGLGAGRLHPIDTSEVKGTPTPRSVLYADRAAPFLSQLLWDAAGLVTRAASPAAHLFESARSLGVAAVTGVEIERDHRLIVAVDGFEGIVATVSLEA